MSSNLEIKISTATDLSGINQARSALNALAGRTAGASEVMAGFNSIAQGNLGAIFGVSRAIKGMWDIISLGSPAIRILQILATVGTLAWGVWKKYGEHVKKAGEETEAFRQKQQQMQEQLAEGARNFNLWLDSLDKAANKLDFTRPKKEVDQMATAFDNAAESAKAFQKVQADFRAQKLNTTLGKITLDEQTAISQAITDRKPESEINAISYNANSQRNAEIYKSKLAESQAEQDRATQSITSTQQELDRLQQQIDDAYSAEKSLVLVAKVHENKALAKIRETDPLYGRSTDADANAANPFKANQLSPEKLESYQADIAAYDEMKQQTSASEKAQQDVNDTLKKRVIELNKILEADKAALELAKNNNALQEFQTANAKNDADLKAKERQAEIQFLAKKVAADKKQAEEDKKTEKTSLENDAKQIEKDFKTREEKRNEPGNALDTAKSRSDEITKMYDEGRRRIEDPAYGKQQKDAEKESERAKAKYKARLARAKYADAHGATGKWIDEMLNLEAEGGLRALADKEKDLAIQLAREQASDIKKTKETLDAIKDKLERNLTLGGTSAGGVA